MPPNEDQAWLRNFAREPVAPSSKDFKPDDIASVEADPLSPRTRRSLPTFKDSVRAATVLSHWPFEARKRPCVATLHQALGWHRRGHDSARTQVPRPAFRP